LSNQHQVTLASFLAYFVMSGMLAPIGIISGPMAEHFDLPVVEVTASFSWLTVGIFIGAVLALGAFGVARIRTLMICVYGLIGLSLLSLLFESSLRVVGVRLGLVGVCCGIGLPAAALVISRVYNADRRASMLVITDGFFSVAGIVCAWLAVYLISHGGHWSDVYLFVAGIAACVVVLALLSDFPETDAIDDDATASATWPLSAWLCIAALCTYTLGQNVILLWLPQYAQSQLGMAAEPAGNLVSQFWSGMFAAQIFVAWWVLKVGVQRLLWLAAICILVFSVVLWVVKDSGLLLVLVTILGFANLGLLKLVMSYATQFTAVASSRLVSSLLLGATTGTALSPWLSSRFVAMGDEGTALQLGSFCYLVMLVLIGLAIVLPRRGSKRFARAA
jgi:TsgA-like MFS transporter